MTQKELEAYQEYQVLTELLQEVLFKRKFKLQCGHHVTFGQFLGNDIVIYNGKNLEIVCLDCGS